MGKRATERCATPTRQRPSRQAGGVVLRGARARVTRGLADAARGARGRAARRARSEQGKRPVPTAGEAAWARDLEIGGACARVTRRGRRRRPGSRGRRPAGPPTLTSRLARRFSAFAALSLGRGGACLGAALAAIALGHVALPLLRPGRKGEARPPDRTIGTPDPQSRLVRRRTGGGQAVATSRAWRSSRGGHSQGRGRRRRPWAPRSRHLNGRSARQPPEHGRSLRPRARSTSSARRRRDGWPDKAGVAQLREVVADIVLALAEGRGHLAHAVGSVAEQGQDAGTGAVGEERGNPGQRRSRRARAGRSGDTDGCQ